ncbi:MAG: thioredoxin domain-containing protein [Anaerolinea sp.]|nr:thioredoxin domain-containing protein [Anaerolinea sp.]
MPNRLANETSPYLLQHADNPVDWFPWGEDAFAKARAEDKPILLSVGYSACHWCHVMAHESFEDAATAALMNRYFVNIKVDREERPDIDNVYMAAVQALTGQGGWPMTVFMTPDGQPFYAGTYFPPADGHGRPGFPRVLEVLHEKWTSERDTVLQSADGITAHLKQAAARAAAGKAEVTPEAAQRAVELFREVFDSTWGGFGMAPKFPSPSNLEFLLSYAAGSGRDDGAEPTALEMVLQTLRHMATGGMYDQLGGGFARYSVDERWLVPHFEKMLYDNVQLVRVYLHAFQITRDPFFERIARETLAYLEREMLDPEGGFYTAQDADSEGIEGKYFVWTRAELDEHLGDDAALFAAWFGVTPGGNFQDPHHPELTGRNVLTNWQDPEVIAERFGLPPPQLAERVQELRTKMLAVRDQRIRPGLDDKLLTSWNGLALAAFAEAGRILGDASYRDVADRTAQFLREKMWRRGRLFHTYKAGSARVDGMLEDYAYAGLGLVELFKLSGEMEHLDWARELFETALREFRDRDGAGFFETSASGETLIVRQKPFFDAATPSGNGAMALLALWVGRYYNRAEGEEVALEVLSQVHDHMLRAHTGFGTLWQAVEFLLAPRREAVIAGEPAARQPLERELGSRYLPFLAIAPTADATGLPLFEGRDVDEGAVAYVCEDMACQMPVTTAEALAAQLD